MNLWPNRMIGDEMFPDDCNWRTLPPGQTGTPLSQWPEWLLRHEARPSKRLSFATWKYWTKDSELLESGLLGPVTLHAQASVVLK